MQTYSLLGVIRAVICEPKKTNFFPFTGVVYTELCRSLPFWLQLLVMPIAKLFFMDPEGGSQTTLHCAVQEGLEPLSGRYFSNCAVQEACVRGRDDALAKKLWEVSERLAALTQPTVS